MTVCTMYPQERRQWTLPGQVLTTSATGQRFPLEHPKEELTFESALEQLWLSLVLRSTAAQSQSELQESRREDRPMLPALYRILAVIGLAKRESLTCSGQPLVMLPTK